MRSQPFLVLGALAPLATVLLPKACRQPVLNLQIKACCLSFALCCGVKVEIMGVEHIIKIVHSLLVGKHSSEWETYVLQVMMATPYSTVLKKKSCFRLPFLWNGGSVWYQPIAIDRSQRTKRAQADY